jgi:hypothetical protein
MTASLLDRVMADTLGPPDAHRSFAARLASEHGWSMSKAESVMVEYKRFCVLAVLAGHPVTPPDAVDQCWHQHLQDSRDYWERFCPHVLGRSFHHVPSRGGVDEQHKHFEQYAQTQRSYERIFGSPPPVALWPPSQQRLFNDSLARRVHLREVFVVPRTTGWLATVVVVVMIVMIAVLLLAKQGPIVCLSGGQKRSAHEWA